MYIYFIRHGETAFNKKHIHQGPDVQLSDEGRMQIGKTAERLKEYPITKLITSDFVRTRESAEIIGTSLGLTPEPQELFREVRMPSSLYGKKHVSVATLRVGLNIISHIHTHEWRHTDSENLYDIRNRILDAVTYLENIGKEHEHIVVLSHAVLINFFVRYMCEHKNVRLRHYLDALYRAAVLNNGSITTIVHDQNENVGLCDWNLISFNDHAHID